MFNENIKGSGEEGGMMDKRTSELKTDNAPRGLRPPSVRYRAALRISMDGRGRAGCGGAAESQPRGALSPPWRLVIGFALKG